MPKSLSSRAFQLVLAALALGLVSAAPAVSSPGGCVDLSGDWDGGSWSSSTTGHSGRLCATLTRVGPDRYRCVFRGTFLMVVPFRYPVTLYVTGCDGGRVCFRATRKLPLCGGTFACRGSATRCSFRANFSSQDDRGVFTLSR